MLARDDEKRLATLPAPNQPATLELCGELLAEPLRLIRHHDVTLCHMPRRPPFRLLRLANPVVRTVLRSRGHRLLSGGLVVLEYEGRTTHRRYAIPVGYVEHGGRVVALAARPERKRWWRTFRESARATLLVQGERRAVAGRVLEGAERRDALRAYLARNRRARKALGVSNAITDAELDAAPAAIVAFRPAG